MHSIESRSAPVATLTVTSIPTGGGVGYTRSPKVGVATTPRTPWEGLVFVPSTIATTSISPMVMLENHDRRRE